MSEFRNADSDRMYFVTLVGWIDLFTRRIYKDMLVQNLQYCIDNKGLHLYAYVIMSNHLHMVCRQENGQLLKVLGQFKSYTAKEFLKEIISNSRESRSKWLLYLFKHFAITSNQYADFHVWQYKSHPIMLDENEIIDQKIAYVHNNPVKAGLVTEPHHYLFSSECIESPLRVAVI